MGTSYNNNLNQVRKTIWLWCKEQIIKTLLIYVQTKTNLTIKPTRYIYIFKENGSCQKVFPSKQSQNSTINLFVPRLNKQFLIQKFFLLMHFLYFEKVNFLPFFLYLFLPLHSQNHGVSSNRNNGCSKRVTQPFFLVFLRFSYENP